MIQLEKSYGNRYKKCCGRYTVHYGWLYCCLLHLLHWTQHIMAKLKNVSATSPSLDMLSKMRAQLNSFGLQNYLLILQMTRKSRISNSIKFSSKMQRQPLYTWIWLCHWHRSSSGCQVILVDAARSVHNKKSNITTPKETGWRHRSCWQWRTSK